jgi:hypothetical protein
MRTVKKEQPVNLFKTKNQPTRDMEAIFTERGDPEYRAKQMILKAREEHLDHSDQGI